WEVITPDNVAYLQTIQVFTTNDSDQEMPLMAGFDANSRLIVMYVNNETDDEVLRYADTRQAVSRLGAFDISSSPIISPSGRQSCGVAGVNLEGFVRCFDLATGEARYLIQTSDFTMAVSWDDTLMATNHIGLAGTDTDAIRIWSLAQSRMIKNAPF